MRRFAGMRRLAAHLATPTSTAAPSALPRLPRSFAARSAVRAASTSSAAQPQPQAAQCPALARAHGRPLDPDYSGGLEEFSVVFTDRGLNHMSKPFQKVMRDLDRLLCTAYGASAAVLLPGSGTYSMEAVARQFAVGKDVLVLRNGFFSYRWTDIFDTCDFTKSVTVLKAVDDGAADPAKRNFGPHPIEAVRAAAAAKPPAVIFVPQIETSTGIEIPESYIAELAAIAREHDALLVLDSIAAGCIWVDMEKLGVDALITAPQKGWSAHACCGVAMLGPRAVERLETTKSNSMCLGLARWHGVMQAFLSDSGPGHAYVTTMPTDGMRVFRDAALETEAFGWQRSSDAQRELGVKVRAMLASKGLDCIVAGPELSGGSQAPGVVVVRCDDPKFPAKMAKQGIQVAAGVPFMLGEEPQTTFRLGLFGLDKLNDIDGAVSRLETGIDAALADN